MVNKWPKQSECDTFYGNPRGINGQVSKEWESKNIINILTPFKMTYAGKPIKSIRVHKKCADSLTRIFNALWILSGKSQKTINEWGVSIFGGIFNYRLMSGGNSLSMHSYACAIDLDPARNGLHDTTPRFAKFPQVVKCFTDEGWVWLGKHDGMHFQAATL